MNPLKILLVVIFGIVAVMMITAMIHLVASYVAVLVVLLVIGLFFFDVGSEKDPPHKPP